MNRAFKVREGAEAFDSALWGEVIFYNEEMAEQGLTELSKEDMNAAIEAGDVEEVEYDPEAAAKIFDQIMGVMSEADESETLFTTEWKPFETLTTYDDEDRATIGEVVLGFIETARDVSRVFALTLHIEARLGALLKYGPEDPATALLLTVKLAAPVASPQPDDPLAVSDYMISFGIKFSRSSVEANRDAGEEFCAWLTRGLAGQGCVVDFGGLD